MQLLPLIAIFTLLSIYQSVEGQYDDKEGSTSTDPGISILNTTGDDSNSTLDTSEIPDPFEEYYLELNQTEEQRQQLESILVELESNESDLAAVERRDIWMRRKLVKLIGFSRSVTYRTRAEWDSELKEQIDEWVRLWKQIIEVERELVSKDYYLDSDIQLADLRSKLTSENDRILNELLEKRMSELNKTRVQVNTNNSLFDQLGRFKKRYAEYPRVESQLSQLHSRIVDVRSELKELDEKIWDIKTKIDHGRKRLRSQEEAVWFFSMMVGVISSSAIFFFVFLVFFFKDEDAMSSSTPKRGAENKRSTIPKEAVDKK